MSRTQVVFAPKDALSDRKTGLVSELSDEGLFIATNSIWPPKTALSLVLTIPGERLPVQITGEVAWARTRETAGMFVTIAEPADHPTRERLRAHHRPAAAAPIARTATTTQD